MGVWSDKVLISKSKENDEKGSNGTGNALKSKHKQTQQITDIQTSL